MWELNSKKGWAQKHWCLRIVVLEKTLDSPLDSKEIQPVNPKRNQSWVFFGRTDAEAEALILWPPDARSWLIWKDHDAGKDWRQEEKGIIIREMQVKTTMRYHLSPVRMAIIKKSTNKCWTRCGEGNTPGKVSWYSHYGEQYGGSLQN